MLAQRLEVRLDAEHRVKLAKLAAARRVPVSKLVRIIIDEAYEGTLREERLRAASRIGELEIEAVPEPDILSRQLEATYDLPNLP